MAEPIEINLNVQSIHVTVQTLAGTFKGEFEADQKLQDVIDKVLLTLDIKPAPGEDWRLHYGAQVLDPKTTIEENHLPDGVELLYERQEGGGGTLRGLRDGR